MGEMEGSGGWLRQPKKFNQIYWYFIRFILQESMRFPMNLCVVCFFSLVSSSFSASILNVFIRMKLKSKINLNNVSFFSFLLSESFHLHFNRPNLNLCCLYKCFTLITINIFSRSIRTHCEKHRWRHALTQHTNTRI